MIRINLLPHKKKVRAAPVEGEQAVGIGLGILIAAAAVVFLGVHGPMEDKVDTQKKRNSQLDQENKKIEKRISNFDALKAAFAAAQKQATAIEELNNARATPANFLFELGTILRSGGKSYL